MSDPKIIVALDLPSAAQALALAERLCPSRCRLKIGTFLFTREGPALVQRLIGMGFDLFLDLKFHDIPHTVAGAVEAAAEFGVWMITVHTLGGRQMMQVAANTLAQRRNRPYLIGVTVLTSSDTACLREVGINDSPQVQVDRLTALAQSAGLDGVVCAAQEARATKQRAGPAFITVTPGIRLREAEGDDQSRVMTPVQALENGSDYLVIGRPITDAPDPVVALAAIDESLQGY